MLDSADISRWYERYGPMVLRRCRALLGNEERALEAMQDVFVRILRQRARLVDDSPASLLFHTATNVCLNTIRASKRRPETAQGELIEQIATYKDFEPWFAARGLIRKIFRHQPETTQIMATLHYLDGMTLQEVATEMGMSVSGVRRRLAHLKRYVHLKHEYDQPEGSNEKSI